MAHRVFTGPFAALECHFEEEVRRLQSDDPLRPVNVLVGSNLLAAYLKRCIAAGGRGIANLRFCTFIDLARRLAGPFAGDDARPRMPRLGAAQILEGILADGVPDLFGAVSVFTGFRDALLDSFRDLRDAGVTPATLDNLVRRSAAETPDRADHLAACATLYREFRSRVSSFRDVDDDFRDAVRGAQEAAAVLGSRTLLIYGIYDVTGQQRDLLVRLKDGLDLTYFVPFVDQSVSAFARPFLEATVQAAGATVEQLIASPPKGDLERLWEHRERMVSPDIAASRFAGDNTASLVSAPGASRAAIEVVREIVRAVGEGIINGFSEAAVILRHSEEDLPVLAEALRLRGIPYYVQGGTPFAEEPLGRAVSAIAALATGSFPRESILTAMELVAASLPVVQEGDWDVSEWRFLTNDLRFLAGADSWDVGTAALISELSRQLAKARSAEMDADDSESELPTPEAVQRRLESAKKLRSAWQRMRAASDWPEALGWEEWAEFLEQRLRPLLGTSLAWTSFEDALDQLSALEQIPTRGGARQPVLRAKVIAALSESMSLLAAPVGRPMRSGVNIISVSAARGLRFPLVIVPGLEEGRFPARLRQDPLLQDEERARVGSGVMLPMRSQRLDEERLLFDMAVRSAQKRLVLVTSRLDESSDRERIPSEFFLRVASLAAGRPIMLRELTEGTVPGFRSVSLEEPTPRTGQPAVDPGEVRLRLIRSRYGMERDALQALAKVDPALLQRPAAFGRARSQRTLTAYDGMISDGGLLAWLQRTAGPASGPFSASRAEEYARCPYLFYLKRVQRLEAWEELEAAECLDALTRGRVVHQILEQFVRQHSGKVLASVPPMDLKVELGGLAAENLESVRPAGIPDLLWEIECDRVKGILEKWLEFELQRTDEGFIPLSVERPFGRFADGEEGSSLVIEAGRHHFVLRGVIDRIDLATDGIRARVIDYKTGLLPASMSRGKGTALMAGERMQLAVYRNALPAMPDLGRLNLVEGEFLHLQFSEATILPRSFSTEEMERAGAKLPEILEVIGDGIEQGSFFARTSGVLYGDRQCVHCDYARICGKDRQHREQRKAADPAVVRFGRMAEIDDRGGDPE